MISPGQFFRLIIISWVLIRNGLDELILATHLFRPVRFLKYLLPWFWFRKSSEPRAKRLCRALEELGPLFVKFGQLLSTRKDLLPDDIADEFARLQDHVRPFPGIQARKIIEEVFNAPVSETFIDFDEQPLASASIAQVHAAKLPSGRAVIIKVVRPGIERLIRRDLRLLYSLADLAQRKWPDARRLRPKDVVAEFEKSLLDELDMVREAANASQLRRNFLHSSVLYVPEIEWELTRSKVLVMERVHGIPISDIKTLKAQGIDLKKLSERGVEIFFTQVFRHCFFHADMHPGNLFVSEHGQYIAVDFGIMGSLSPEDQNYLAQNFLAFFNRDYRRVAQLHVESGWVPMSTRVNEFEAAIRTVCEPIFQKPLKEISFGHFLLHLFQTARRFNMEVQPQLILLQKTLLNIEGLGRQLYPELDLWQTAKPFFEKWMRDQVGPVALARRLGDQIPKWVTLMPQVTEFAQHMLLEQRLTYNKMGSSGHPLERRQPITIPMTRIVAAIIGGACLVSAAVIYGLDSHATYNILGAPIISWIIAAIAAVFIFVAFGS